MINPWYELYPTAKKKRAAGTRVTAQQQAANGLSHVSTLQLLTQILNNDSKKTATSDEGIRFSLK